MGAGEGGFVVACAAPFVEAIQGSDVIGECWPCVVEGMVYIVGTDAMWGRGECPPVGEGAHAGVGDAVGGGADVLQVVVKVAAVLVGASEGRVAVRDDWRGVCWCGWGVSGEAEGWFVIRVG